MFYLRKIINTYDVLTKKAISLRWANSEETRFNFGDAINPDLFQKISHKRIIYYKNVFKIFKTPTFLFIGSNLDNLNTKKTIICGSGFKSSNSGILKKPLKVIAVRGPLTQKKLQSLGIECPDIFCDPGLLVSDFYPIQIEKKYKVGVIAHYVDKEILEKLPILNENLSYKILNIENSPSEFIREVNECETIISSSLHGIITAHSYKIPATWVKLSDKVLGGNFKFNDYYESVGAKNVEPIILSGTMNLRDIVGKATYYPHEKNKTEFLAAMKSFLKNI